MSNANPEAWYRHFWPWFIVVLLTTAVVASLFTVGVAFRHADIVIKAP